MRIVVDTNAIVSTVLRLNSLPALQLEEARAAQPARYLIFTPRVPFPML
jgi:hypothetical protein